MYKRANTKDRRLHTQQKENSKLLELLGCNCSSNSGPRSRPTPQQNHGLDFRFAKVHWDDLPVLDPRTLSFCTAYLIFNRGGSVYSLIQNVPDRAGILAQTPPQRPQPFRCNMLRLHRITNLGIVKPLLRISASRHYILPVAARLIHVQSYSEAYYFMEQQLPAANICT